MPIRAESQPRGSTLKFLKRCFAYVRDEWPRAPREQLPDEGFEQGFRNSCISHLPSWSISAEREMRLGSGLETASGVLHEVDVIARGVELTAILELKNRTGRLPDKNDVIVFFSKVIDFLCANPSLASENLCLVFLSSNSYEPAALAACLGLGIHPVGPEARPLPVLVNNAMIMESEIHAGLQVAPGILDRFDDLCAQLNNLSSVLSDTWIDGRCGYVSDDTILLRALPPLTTMALGELLRKLNADCTDILREFRLAKDRV